jgi:hypothetical protein
MGKIMMLAKMRRYVATTRGSAELILMRMDAVETATILTNSARYGGNLGFSLTVRQR